MSRFTTLKVLKIFPQGVMGAVIGAISYPLGTLPLNRHLPEAFINTYKAIYKTVSVGPNLKAVAYVTVPVAGVVIPPLLLASSTLFGFVRGAISAVWPDRDDGKGFFSRVFGSLSKDLSEADQTLIEDFLPQLRDYHPAPLPEGEEPFDISPLRALRGVVCGVVLTVVEAPLLALVTVLHAPRIFFVGLKSIYAAVDNLATFMLALLMTFLLVGVLILIPPVLALGAICYGIGAGCARAYSKGVVHAVYKVFQDLSNWHDFLAKI